MYNVLCTLDTLMTFKSCTWDIHLYFIVSAAIVNHVFTQELSSTMRNGRPVYTGQEIIFTCVTRGSSIIAWSSEEYIGSGGAQLIFSTLNSPDDTKISQTYPDTVATLVSITGSDVLTSTLRIVTSSNSLSASVTCHDANLGTRNTTNFYVNGIQRAI